jgi:lysophospholipase L1-like esterase
MSKLAEISVGQVDEGKISEVVEEYLAEHPITGTVTADDVATAVENYVDANRDSLKGEKGDKGSKGDKGNAGSNGKSAYEIACDNGFTGTEAEWLASLGGSGEGIDLSEYAKKSDIAEISEYFEEPEFTQVSFEAIKREYISSRGIIAGNVSSDGWQHSTPIAVSKGDTIKLHASGYATNVAMISTCDFNGENIIPRVVSEYSESGDVWNYKDYYFTVPDAGYIMISYSTTPGQAFLYVRGAAGREKMSQRVEQLFQASINSNLCHIFKKVICIGDSYTEGYMSVDDGSATVHKEYSWVEYMAQITGNNWINRAVSGTTADTWLSHKNGFAKVESDGKAQAYVIGLVINDSREENSQKLLALGTPDDIGTETVSYYGRLAKIIVKLAEINPDAIILVNTCPLYYAFERISPYNEAVRTIVNHFKETYRIHCIDLADTYHDLYFDATYTRDYSSSHPTALGQAKMAKMYEYVLSDYMNKHPKAFDDIPWIPYV